jgi:hypothetical protein
VALILWRNWLTDAATTLSATSEATPVTRLRDPRPARAWHGATSEDTITIDFGASRLVTHVGLINHNLTLFGVIRIRLLAADEVVFEQVFEPWDPVEGLGDDPWGERLGGYPDTTAVEGFVAQKVISVGDVQADACEIALADESDGFGHVVLGCLFVGVGTRFDFDFGWQIEWQTTGETTSTDGGGVVAREGVQSRLLRCRAPDLTEIEALGTWDDLGRIVSTTRPVIVQLFPEADEVLSYRTTVYGVRQSADAVTGENGGFSTGLVVKELRT